MLQRATLLRCGACSPRPARFNSCAAKGYSRCSPRLATFNSMLCATRATLLRCGTFSRPQIQQLLVCYKGLLYCDAFSYSFYAMRRVLQRATLLRCGACSPRPARFNSFSVVCYKGLLYCCAMRRMQSSTSRFNSFYVVCQRANLLRCGACSPRPARSNSFSVVCYEGLLYCDAAHVVLDQHADSTASMLCAKGYSKG